MVIMLFYLQIIYISLVRLWNFCWWLNLFKYFLKFDSWYAMLHILSSCRARGCEMFWWEDIDLIASFRHPFCIKHILAIHRCLFRSLPYAKKLACMLSGRIGMSSSRRTLRRATGPTWRSLTRTLTSTSEESMSVKPLTDCLCSQLHTRLACHLYWQTQTCHAGLILGCSSSTTTNDLNSRQIHGTLLDYIGHSWILYYQQLLW